MRVIVAPQFVYILQFLPEVMSANCDFGKRQGEGWSGSSASNPMSAAQFAASSRGALPIGSLPGSNEYMRDATTLIADRIARMCQFEVGGVSKVMIRLCDCFGRVSAWHPFDMTPAELPRMRAPNTHIGHREIGNVEAFRTIMRLGQWIHMLPNTQLDLVRGSMSPSQQFATATGVTRNLLMGSTVEIEFTALSEAATALGRHVSYFDLLAPVLEEGQCRRKLGLKTTWDAVDELEFPSHDDGDMHADPQGAWQVLSKPWLISIPNLRSARQSALLSLSTRQAAFGFRSSRTAASCSSRSVAKWR